MFCEGFYLHQLISNTFEPPKSLVRLYVFGWRESSYYQGLRRQLLSRVKVFQYWLRGVGPGADPGVQAVSSKVTLINPSTRRQAAITFRQAFGYLPSQRTSPPIDRYRIVLLDNRDTCM